MNLIKSISNYDCKSSGECAFVTWVDGEVTTHNAANLRLLLIGMTNPNNHGFA